LRIARFPSLTEPQFFGCTAAFVDSLLGELNAATSALRRLEGQAKGSAFAYEMNLDTHRYGALIVLDRWSEMVAAFGPHLRLSRGQSIIDGAAARAQAGEAILGKANQLIDAAHGYGSELVEVCALAFQSLNQTFEEERAEAGRWAKLGPMLPEEYTAARRIFLEDLAVR